MKHKNNELIKKLAIGTVQFGLDYGISNKDSKINIEECRNIIELSRNNEIDTLDTAFQYGISEEILGVLNVTGWKVISKFPKIEKGKTVREYFNESLTRLNLPQLYAYISHDSQNLIDNPSIWHELQKLKETGLINKIGASLYSPNQLIDLSKNEIFPDIIQVPYNVFDRRFEFLFEELKKVGTEIHTRSTFLQGLFFNERVSLHPFFNEALPNIEYLHKSFPTKKELAGALLNFSLQNNNIDKVVIGVNNHYQLKENIDGFIENSIPISDDLRIDNENILLPYKWIKF